MQSTIQAQIQRELAINHGLSTSDRRAALQVARSLQSQLFFYEVEWGGRVLQDGVEDVYMFLDDQDGPSDSTPMREELPTGVITVLTKCYSPSCGEGLVCYTPRCPRNNVGTEIFYWGLRLIDTIDRAMLSMAQRLDQMPLHDLSGRPGPKQCLVRSSFHYLRARSVGKRRCLSFIDRFP